MSIRCLSKLKLYLGFLKEPLENHSDLHIYLIKRDARNILGYFDILYTLELAHYYIRSS